MGVTEMLLATASAGMLVGLFGGQPILIVGSTGPLLVFEEALYQVCLFYCSSKHN